MKKNKQKRKIKDKKHAHIRRDKKNPIANRNTGYDYLTSNREPLISSREAIVEWRESTNAPIITINPIFDNTEEE